MEERRGGRERKRGPFDDPAERLIRLPVAVPRQNPKPVLLTADKHLDVGSGSCDREWLTADGAAPVFPAAPAAFPGELLERVVLPAGKDVEMVGGAGIRRLVGCAVARRSATIRYGRISSLRGTAPERPVSSRARVKGVPPVVLLGASAGLVDAACVAPYLGVERGWVYEHADELGVRRPQSVYEYHEESPGQECLRQSPQLRLRAAFELGYAGMIVGRRASLR